MDFSKFADFRIQYLQKKQPLWKRLLQFNHVKKFILSYSQQV